MHQEMSSGRRATRRRSRPRHSLALFADERLTRDELKAELIELVDAQRAQMKSTLMVEVHEMRQTTVSPGTPAEIVDRG